MPLDNTLLHIGMPKALSTWLQKNLFIPENGFTQLQNPFESQLSFISPHSFDFSADKTNEAIMVSSKGIDPGHIPVISNESLAGNIFYGGYNRKEIADRLYSVFPEAKVLIVIREQRQMIRSLYKTLVFFGMPHRLKDLLCPSDVHMGPLFCQDYLYYDRLVEYYQSLFGAEHVRVLAYEEFQHTPNVFIDKVGSFCEAKHINHDGLPLQKRLNVSQSLATIHARRLLNSSWYSTPFNYGGYVTVNIDKRMELLAKSKKSHVWVPKVFELYLEKKFQQQVGKYVDKSFMESNRRLAELTGMELEKYGYYM